MTSCLLADQASNTSFWESLKLICIHSRSFSHYGQHNNATTIYQKRLGPESERSQRRWPESRCAETPPHQEPSQISRRLLDVQDA
jgi:hypothetical protein